VRRSLVILFVGVGEGLPALRQFIAARPRRHTQQLLKVS